MLGFLPDVCKEGSGFRATAVEELVGEELFTVGELVQFLSFFIEAALGAESGHA